MGHETSKCEVDEQVRKMAEEAHEAACCALAVTHAVLTRALRTENVLLRDR